MNLTVNKSVPLIKAGLWIRITLMRIRNQLFTFMQDPDLASKNYADPDPQLRIKVKPIIIIKLYDQGHNIPARSHYPH
jgi:hypothetical protein